MSWTQIFKPVIKRAITLWALATRPMMLGVRILAFDANGRILLVRHSYLPGLYLPGGGVDPGETCLAAALRELDEETGHAPDGEVRLFGLYLNRRQSRRNHVALYVAQGVRARRVLRLPNHEIIEIGWFDPDALPADVTDATRRRIDEVRGKTPPPPEW